MRFLNKFKSVFFVLVCLLPLTVLADESMADISGNLFGLAVTMHAFFKAVCLTAGCGLLMGSLAKYLKYRKNPYAAPLNASIFLLIFGLLLIGMYFLPMQADS